MFVDAFVEKGYFEVEDANEHFLKAKELGFGIRIHADEFADSQAGAAAAKWGAVSADHLEKTSTKSIEAMAKAGVTAVLLPGTSLYCAMEYTDAQRFITAGCPVALATDFNPGSCRVDNLGFIATLGALHCKMNLATTIAAITYVPSCTLGLAQQKGHLALGADADCLIFEYENLSDWIADLGQRPPKQILISGASVS